MQGSVCPRQGRSAALSGALVASSIREDQHIGGVLTHSWLPCLVTRLPMRVGSRRISVGGHSPSLESSLRCYHVLLSLLQQSPVLSYLLLQAGLDAQEHLVLLVLTLHLTADAGQLLLYRVDLPLDLLQQAAVARFGFCQGVFQRAFRAELRLQLDLQVLHVAPQLSELVAACLDVLAARSDLTVDFFNLEETNPKHTFWMRKSLQGAGWLTERQDSQGASPFQRVLMETADSLLHRS